MPSSLNTFSLSVYLWLACVVLQRSVNCRLLFEKVTVLENTRLNTAILDLRDALIRHGEGPLPANATAYANQQEAFWPFVLDNFVIKLVRPLDREAVCLRQMPGARGHQHIPRSSLNHYEINSHKGNNQFTGNPDTQCLPSACCQILHVIIMPSPTDVPKAVFIQVAVQDVNDNAPKFPQIPSPYTSIVESIDRSDRIWLPQAFDPDSSAFSVVQYRTINWKHGNESHFQLNFAETDDLLTSELTAGETDDLLPSKQAGNLHVDSYLNTQMSHAQIRPYLSITGPLDREMCDMYSFTLLAIDGGDQTTGEASGKNVALTGSVSIVLRITDANDNRPVFSRPVYQAKLAENLMTTHVVDFDIHDNDVGDNGRVTVSIHDPTRQAQHLFRVVLHPVATTKASSSMASYATPQTGPPSSHYKGFLQLLRQVDAERYPGLLRFSLIASDHGQPSLSAYAEVQVEILNVNDNPPVITFLNQGQRLSDNRLSLSEGTTPSRAIVSLVHVTDDDSPAGQIQCQLVEEADYFLLEEAPGGSPALSPGSQQQQRQSSFDQDLHPGSIVAGYRQFVLRTRKPLDRETKAHHTVSIACTDSDDTQPLSRNASLHIAVTDINDNSPQFDKPIYLGRVPENQAHAEVQLSSPMQVSDPDLGLNALLHFDLLSVEPLGSTGSGSEAAVKARSQFRVDPRSGQLWSTVPLDCEARREYKLVLVARDSGLPDGQSSSATVLVTVDDVNDNPPVFTVSQYSFEIPENAPSGTEVGQVKAIDKDFTEANQKVRYSIHGRPEDLLLMSIDHRTGVLRSRRPIDRESRSSISLVVMAENEVPFRQSHQPETLNLLPVSHRTGSLSGEANVLITILNLNDNPPEFRLSEPYRTHIKFIWEQLPVAETISGNDTSGTNADRKGAGDEEKRDSTKSTTGPVCERLVHKVSDKDVAMEHHEQCCHLELLDDFNGLFLLLPQANDLLCATRRPSEPQTYKLTLIARDGLTNDSHSSQTHFTVVIRSDPDTTSWLPSGKTVNAGVQRPAPSDRLSTSNQTPDPRSLQQQAGFRKLDWSSGSQDGEKRRLKPGLSPQAQATLSASLGYREKSRAGLGNGQVGVTAGGSHHTIIVVFMATVAGLLCLLLLLSILLTKRCIIDMKPEFTKGDLVQRNEDSPVRPLSTIPSGPSPKSPIQTCTLVPLSSPTSDAEHQALGYYPTEYLFQQPAISQQYSEAGTLNTTAYSLARVSPGAGNMPVTGFFSPSTLVRQPGHRRRTAGPVVFAGGPVLLPQTLLPRRQTLNNSRGGEGAGGRNTELVALNKIEQASNNLNGLSGVSTPATLPALTATSPGWVSSDNQAFQPLASDQGKGFCSLIPGDFEGGAELAMGSQYQTKCEAYNQSVYQTIDSKFVPSPKQVDGSNSIDLVTHDPTKVRFNEATKQRRAHSGCTAFVEMATNGEHGNRAYSKSARNHAEPGECFQSSFV